MEAKLFLAFNAVSYYRQKLLHLWLLVHTRENKILLYYSF